MTALQPKSALDHLMKMLSDELQVREVHIGKFVGLEIKRSDDKSRLILHQRAYVTKILEQYNMLNCKSFKSPIDDTKALQTEESGDEQTKAPFRELIGSLLYAACLSRPDIIFAVNFLGRFSNNPMEKHWTAAKRILRYLKVTIDLGIEFTHGDELDLDCYTDADWGGDTIDRKSTSCVICFLSNGPIVYKAKKQSVVAQSTTEAEYIAASLGVKEILGANNILQELEVKVGNTSLNMDNQSAIRLIKNPEYHQDTKHIGIKTHLIRDHYKKGLFHLNYVPSDDQKADVLTKALSPATHVSMVQKIGLVPLALIGMILLCQ